MKKAVYHSAAACSAIIAATFGVAAPAAAQDAAGQDDGAILVTARRTQERLQDVPVGVAAFDRAALIGPR